MSLWPPRTEDVTDDYVGWLNDPAVRLYTEIAGAETIASVRRYVDDTNAAKDAAMWRIVTTHSGYVGNIRLSHIRWRHRRAEVAILIGRRDQWGKGIATEAIRLVTQFAWNRLDLHKLTAGIVAPNVGSRRAFEKAGYTLEAVLRGHCILDEGLCDVHWMTAFAPQSDSGGPVKASRGWNE